MAVTASADHTVVDRRRVELIEPGVPEAPVEHAMAGLGDAAARRLLDEVRAAVTRATAASLDALADSLPAPIRSVSIRAWPLDFPEEIGVLRRPPHQSRADSVMYCQVLADCAQERGWDVHLYEARDVEAQAARLLGPRSDEVLHGPRARLGPPWAKDHRMALAATVLAG